MTYKYQDTTYHIAVSNPQGVSRGIVQASLDDQDLPCRPASLPLIDDGLSHRVRLTLG